jgi:hypothetical protein
MAEVSGHGAARRSVPRQGAAQADRVRREAPAIVGTTQWQQYLNRIRRLVRRSPHP